MEPDALTAEVRAEVAQALESVTVDTSGLVTTEALAAAGYVDVQKAEQIALDNALLNEGEVVREIQLIDGAYVFLTSTGREITAPVPEGAAVYDSGHINITSQVSVGCAAAWMRRVGDRVTAVLHDVNFNEGGEVFWPREGFRIARFTDAYGGQRYRIISSVMRDSDGVAEVLSLPGMWDGGFFWNAHAGKQAELDAASLPSQVDELRYEWFTNDLPPVTPPPVPAGGA